MKYVIAAFAFVGLSACGNEDAEPPHEDGHEHGNGEAQGQPTTAVEDTAVAGHARDPKCGMTVETEGAISAEVRGVLFYFCSQQCRDMFVESPADYTGGLPGDPCVCTTGMPNCRCGHCSGDPERCACGDPEPEGEGGEHDHDH